MPEYSDSRVSGMKDRSILKVKEDTIEFVSLQLKDTFAMELTSVVSSDSVN
jgi:hypothetical protein